MTRKKNFIDEYDLSESVQIINSYKKGNEDFLNKLQKTSAEVLLKGVKLKCKNQKQKEFVNMIDENEITIAIGDSGVGKSYVSIIKALELLKEGKYEKIFIITPIVEIEESIGYLKGDLDSKTAPYLYSIYYLVDKIVGSDIRKKLVENKIIEPLCISYIRGCNLDNCVILSDESQNFSKKATLSLLTRIGYNARFIISGDLNQIDKFKNPNDSGLKYAFDNLKDIKGIGFIEFGKEDIVRNPIIGKIIDRFNKK